MADVTLSYKGSDILELSDSGSATLKTGGTYCEADIEVEYVKPSGGGSSVSLLASGTYTRAETGTSDMDIPVSVQGTIVEVLVVSQGTPSGVAGSFAWGIYYPSNNSTIDSVFTNGIYLCKTQTTNDTTAFSMPRSGTQATSNSITCKIPSSGYPILTGTYNWYVWGVA